jgi:hypothetical protein
VTSELDQDERGALAYLLTSPFSSYIGIFEVIPRVAAAEMRITEEEFRSRIERLQALGLVATESNYVLVKVWFMHSSWQVYLKPKAKARLPALQDMLNVPNNLAAQWRISAQTSGVPSGVINEFMADVAKLAATGEEPSDDDQVTSAAASPLDTLSIRGAQGTANKTTSTSCLNKDLLPTTAPADSPSGSSSGGGRLSASDSIKLTSLAEPHRRALQETTTGLPPQRQQEIGDELSAALAAIERGQREPIQSVRAWLRALADDVRAGFSVAARGLAVAQAREAGERRVVAAAFEAERVQKEVARRAADTRLAEDALAKCTPEQLIQVLDSAKALAGKFPGRPLSQQVCDEVLAGRLPAALAGVYVRQSLLTLNLVSEGTTAALQNKLDLLPPNS